MSNNPPAQNKRAAPRHEYINFAWYKRVDDGANELDEGVARSCDVSDAGVGMVVTRPMPGAAKVFLELIGRAGSISAVGTVMHCSDLGNGCFRVGIRIDSIPPTDELTWRQMVDG